MTAALLEVEALDAGYGEAQVLFGATLSAQAGEVVAVVGANGAGKTTLLSTVAGLVRARSGRVLFKGEDVTRRAPHRLVAGGLALVPEGGRLFPFMTVEENLELGAYAPGSRRAVRERLDEAMATFPILAERRSQLAGRLSGGERQMCAIARALMSRPSLLMLDEPSVGLSPLMVERVFDIVGDLARRGGLTVVLVEQHVGEALDLADRGYVIDHGRILRGAAAAELRHDREIQETYMGL